mgnify:CR=1 FL=1
MEKHVQYQNRTKGFINAMISSCSFGLIPLFSVPVMEAGMETPSLLIYRFLFGATFILLGMAYMKTSLKITFGQFWRILILALSNDVTALTMVYGYNFMPSGAACTIQFSYPIFTCLLMMIFFHEKLTLRTAIAIVLAVMGVAALSGIDMSGCDSSLWIGVGLELFAGFSYAIYLVLVPVLNVGKMDCLKLTFYVFLMGSVLLLCFTPFTPTCIQPINSWKIGGTLLLLGLVPTAVSNFTLIVGLKNIGSTLTSILGALEPLTAMAVGVLVFTEPFNLITMFGLVCIVVAVLVLVMKDMKFMPCKEKRATS